MGDGGWIRLWGIATQFIERRTKNHEKKELSKIS
jgi:hypothetical protein